MRKYISLESFLNEHKINSSNIDQLDNEMVRDIINIIKEDLYINETTVKYITKKVTAIATLFNNGLKFDITDEEPKGYRRVSKMDSLNKMMEPIIEIDIYLRSKLLSALELSEKKEVVLINSYEIDYLKNEKMIDTKVIAIVKKEDEDVANNVNSTSKP